MFTEGNLPVTFEVANACNCDPEIFFFILGDLTCVGNDVQKRLFNDVIIFVIVKMRNCLNVHQ